MDEHVRELGRRAQASPHDLAAGHALARALERGGDVVGAWRERCRLARAGDEEALRVLSAPSRDARALGDPLVLEHPGNHVVCGGNEHGVLQNAAGQAQLLDPGTLAARWTAPGLALGMVGTLAVLGERNGESLRICTAHAGEVLAQIELPGVPALPLVVSADGYLAAAVGEGGWRAHAVVDVGGQTSLVRARPARGSPTPSLAGGGLLVGEGALGDESTYLLAHDDHGDDAPLWTAPGYAVCGDVRDVLLVTERGERRATFTLVGAGDGQARWSRQVEVRPPVRGALTADAVVLAAYTIGIDDVPDRLDVVGLARTSGELLWHCTSRVGPHFVLRLAVGREVLVLAYGPPCDPDELSVPVQAVRTVTYHALDATTGADLWTFTPDAPGPHHAITLHAVGGAYVSWLRRHLVRLGPG